ncbi:LuxR C-terminal-related transcriptional regulator [Sporichthya brevicatena]|uniref:LuxR C-terminal-related transcriptional regulator n=1 Tax=Sporichthya brevicatena TaxID=171442 RepID=A0ABP3RB60_9ACTN
MSESQTDAQIAQAVEAVRILGRDGSEPGELIDVLIEELQQRLPALDSDLSAAFSALVSMYSLQVERSAAEQQRRSETLARLHDAMIALRPFDSPQELLERSTMEACHACGFDRAVLLRVEGSTLVPESVYIEGDPTRAAELLAASRAAPMPLQMGINETEALRRRRPLMVRDTAKDPGVPEMAFVYGTTSYVAAPIIPEGRVIGFLHADYCHHTSRVVDEFDRDALFAFAEGFGFAYERATLLHRLRAQGAEVRRLLSSAEAVVRSHAEAELELVRMGDAGLASARSTAGLIAAPTSLQEVLTRRECEVLRLLSAGHSNSTIAEQLVVSEATVKSHVQRILRRLNVRNRIEAAAVYHGLTGERNVRAAP